MIRATLEHVGDGHVTVHLEHTGAAEDTATFHHPADNPANFYFLNECKPADVDRTPREFTMTGGQNVSFLVNLTDLFEYPTGPTFFIAPVRHDPPRRKYLISSNAVTLP